MPEICIESVTITPNPVMVVGKYKIEVEIYALYPSAETYPGADTYPGSYNLWAGTYPDAETLPGADTLPGPDIYE